MLLHVHGLDWQAHGFLAQSWLAVSLAPRVQAKLNHSHCPFINRQWQAGQYLKRR